MRAHGLEGLRNSLVKRTTLPGLSPVAAEDLVRRNFTACRPDAVWLSDFERHEALFYRVEVNGLHLRVVAATCPKLRAA
jgi:transposase InsO family protein